MEDVFVARLMSAPVRSVSPGTTVEDAARLMLEAGIGSVVVTDDDGQLQGILTSTDFVDIVARSKPKAETTVAAYMTTVVATVSPQVPVRQAAATMQQHGVHHLPVVDDEGGVVGIVTTSDLTAYLSDARPEAEPN